MPTFTFAEIGKFLGRNEIRRVQEKNRDSAYLGLSVAIDKDGAIFYVETASDKKNEIHCGFAPLPDTAVVLWKVTKFAYTEQSVGTGLLAGVKRIFEGKEVKYVAFTGNPDGTDLKMTGVWNMQRTTSGYNFSGNGAAKFHADIVEADYLGLMSKTVARVNKNDKPIDQRRLWWDHTGDITAYGKFIAQKQADAATMKTRKKAASDDNDARIAVYSAELKKLADAKVETEVTL